MQVNYAEQISGMRITYNIIISEKAKEDVNGWKLSKYLMCKKYYFLNW